MALRQSPRLLKKAQLRGSDTQSQELLDRAQMDVDGLPPSVRDEVRERIRWNAFIILKRGANLDEMWNHAIRRTDFPGKLPHGSLVGMHLQLIEMFEKLNAPQVTPQERSALLQQTRGALGSMLPHLDSAKIKVKKFLRKMTAEYRELHIHACTTFG